MNKTIQILIIGVIFFYTKQSYSSANDNQNNRFFSCLKLLKAKFHQCYKFCCCDLCCIFNKDNNSISLIEPELEKIRLLEIKEEEPEIEEDSYGYKPKVEKINPYEDFKITISKDPGIDNNFNFKTILPKKP